MVPKDKHIQREKSKCLERKLRKEKNMTKSFQDFKKEYLEELGSEAKFQDFKKEYLEELGSEAKEEYNKALKEFKKEKQK